MKRCALGALVRRGASGVHRAPVRAGAAAHHRPAAARGSAAAHVRSVSGAAPARADSAAGRHRRHRRGEPQGDRAMAVAAHRGGRSRHPARRARRRRHRLRHRLSRARPHVARRCRRQASAVSTRRRARSSPACRATTRSWREAIKAGARGRRPGRLGDAGAALAGRDARCRPASPSRGPIRAPFLVTFRRAAAQRPADRGGRRRPRAVLDQSRTRRHRAPRAGGHGWRRAYWCRR